MRLWGTIALSLALAGCEPPSASMPRLLTPNEIQSKYRRKADIVIAWAREDTVFPDCRSAPRERRACGLISDEMLSDTFGIPFIVNVCKETAENMSASCIEQFQAEALSRFRARYDRADPSVVATQCADSACATLRSIELAWLASHNAAVREISKRKLRQIVAAYEGTLASAHRERQRRIAEDQAWQSSMRATARGFQAAGQSLQQPAGETNAQMAHAANQCSSDFGCGPGSRCVKPQFQTQGTCATTVNEYGTPVYTLPRSDSVGPGGPGDCQFGTDCPAGFRCEKPAGQITGHCLR